ncbi:MAG: XAC2610-related protein [Longimicrobiaceae bacterium]
MTSLVQLQAHPDEHAAARTVRSLVCLVVCLGVAACGRGRSADSPPARVAAPVSALRAPARDSAPRWLEPRQPGDQCRRADGADDRPHPSSPSGAVDHEDLSHGLAFLCTLREGHTARLVLHAYAYGGPRMVLVYAPPGATVAADTLRFSDESEPPYAGATIMEGEDLNGDGWTDVRVMTFHGTGGRMFDVFRYDPAHRRFEKDTVLSGQGNIRRVADTSCTRMSWRMGGSWSWMDLCWRNGRWVRTRAESHAEDPALSTRDVLVYVHEKSELRGGRMRVVSADTIRDRIRR